MTIKLKLVPALYGHSDDAAYTDSSVLIDEHGNVFAIFFKGVDTPVIKPSLDGKLHQNGEGVWHYSPPDTVYRGACSFCGGDIVIPHGHSYGSCYSCGSV